MKEETAYGNVFGKPLIQKELGLWANIWRPNNKTDTTIIETLEQVR